MRWKLVLEYDGTDFVGWGVQPGLPSVQGAVEDALATLVQHPVRIAVSGRTDAGVHALGQVATFDTTTERDAEDVRNGLNARLPATIACLMAERVADDFDPRRAAKSKLYRYRWLDRPAPSPLRARRVWHVRSPLDVAAMDAGARHLAGSHDFATFRAARCQATHTLRTIPVFGVARVGDEVHLETEGQGFLRHMVRIVAGSLVEVGRGRRSPGWMGEILAARDRSAAGQTAPAHGLTLVAVRYR